MSHDPTSPPDAKPLPPLHRATLSPDELDALRADILACADLIDVQIRRQHHAMQQEAPAAGPSAQDALHHALDLLALRAVPGVQLRYRFDGLEWWDTLLWRPHGLELVRIAHDWAAYEAEHQAARPAQPHSEG